MQGDTFVYNYKYSKFYKSESCNDTASYNLIGFFREDSITGKVYYRNATSDSIEVLLYDFDIQEGDTIIVNASLSDTSEKVEFYVLGVEFESVYNNIHLKYVLGDKEYLDTSMIWWDGVGGERGPIFVDYFIVGQSQVLYDFKYSSLDCDCPNLIISENKLFFTDNYLSIKPNPFNPSTRISYNLGLGRTGTLQIFDIRGKLVFSRPIQGTGTVTWDARGLGSGVYVLKVLSGGKIHSRKLILQR